MSEVGFYALVCIVYSVTTLQNIIYTPKYTKFCTVINIYRIYSLLLLLLLLVCVCVCVCGFEQNSRPLALDVTFACDSHINWIDKMRCDGVRVKRRRTNYFRWQQNRSHVCVDVWPHGRAHSSATRNEHQFVARFYYFIEVHLNASESRWNIYYILKCT